MGGKLHVSHIFDFKFENETFQSGHFLVKMPKLAQKMTKLIEKSLTQKIVRRNE